MAITEVEKMRKLTWREFLVKEKKSCISLLIASAFIFGVLLFAVTKAESLWMVPVVVVFYLFFNAITISASKSNSRICSCGELLRISQIVECPNCKEVCPYCGKKVEVE